LIFFFCDNINRIREKKLTRILQIKVLTEEEQKLFSFLLKIINIFDIIPLYKAKREEHID